jgi:hypothetical protein
VVFNVTFNKKRMSNSSTKIYNSLIIACDLCFFSPVKFCSFNTLMYPSKNIYWQKLWPDISKVFRPPQRVNQGNRNRLVRFGKGKQRNCILCTTPNIRSRTITICSRCNKVVHALNFKKHIKHIDNSSLVQLRVMSVGF